METATTLRQEGANRRFTVRVPQYLAGLRAIFAIMVSLVRIARERSRSRRALASLSDRMLKDVGLSRVDALRESRKFFWQA